MVYLAARICKNNTLYKVTDGEHIFACARVYSVGKKSRTVCNLKVFPVYRQQGYAGTLLQYVVESEQGKNIRLCANPEENTIPLCKLVEFYKKHGFIITSETNVGVWMKYKKS